MRQAELVDWLVHNAGPVIRFRTMTEVLPEQDVGVVSRLLDEFLLSPILNEWLERLKPDFTPQKIHSDMPEAFENSLCKIRQLGLRAGLQPLDNKTINHRGWLSDSLEDASSSAEARHSWLVAACALSYAGYSSVTPVDTLLKMRLRFLDDSHKPDEHSIAIPTLHDILGISNSEGIMTDLTLRKNAESMIGRIIHGEYMDTGIVHRTVDSDRPGTIDWFHALFDPHDITDETGGLFLLLMEMLTPFKEVQKSEWFSESLKILDSFRTDRGTYLFPESWLHEKDHGYWIHGDFMAMECSDRFEIVLECESTFRVLRIKQLSH